MIFLDPFEEEAHLEYKEKSKRKFDALKAQFSQLDGEVVKRVIQITKDYPNLPKSIVTAMALTPVQIGAESIAKIADLIGEKQLQNDEEIWDEAFAAVENTEFVKEKMVDDFSINLANTLKGDNQLGVWGWAMWDGLTHTIRTKNPFFEGSAMMMYRSSLLQYDKLLEEGMLPEEAQAHESVPIWVKDTKIPNIGTNKGAWGEMKEWFQIWKEAEDMAGEAYVAAMFREAFKGNTVNYDRDRVMFTESLTHEGNPVFEKMVEQTGDYEKSRKIFYEHVGVPIKMDEAIGVQTYTSMANPNRIRFDPWKVYDKSPEGNIERLMNMTGPSTVPGMTPAESKRGRLQTYTPGRYEAAQVSEPGTKAYNAISGTIDGAYNLVSEAGVGKIIRTLGKLGQGVKTASFTDDAVKAAKIGSYTDFFKMQKPDDVGAFSLLGGTKIPFTKLRINPRQSQIIRRGIPETRGAFNAGRRLYKEAGLSRGLRGTVFAPSAVELINSPFGRKIVTALTNEDKVSKLMRLPGIGDLDVRDVQRIADSSSDADTAEILAELFNAKNLVQLPGNQSALLNGALRQSAATGARLQKETGVVKQGIGKVLSTIGNEDAAFRSIGSYLSGGIKRAKGVIAPSAKTGIDDIDTLFGFKAGLTSGWDPYWTSFLSLTPEMGMSLSNRDMAVRQLIGHMQVVGYKAEEMEDPVRALLRIADDDPDGIMQFAWEQILRDIERVKKVGGNELWIRKQAKQMFETGGDIRAYFINEAGEEMPFVGDVVEEIMTRDIATGSKVKLLVPSVHLLAEMGELVAPLIDYRQINRAMGKIFTQYGDASEDVFSATFNFWKQELKPEKIANIWRKSGETPFVIDGQFKGFIGGKNLTDDAITLTLDYITRNVFKPLVLLRGAWFVRVFLEESLRMSAANLENMFAHPLNYMSWVKSHGDNKALLGKKYSDKFWSRTIRGKGEDPSKLLESEEYINATNSGFAAGAFGVGSRGRQYIGKNWIRVKPGDAGYVQGAGFELMQLRKDPVARYLAKNGYNSETIAWFKGAEGLRYREELYKRGGKKFRELLYDEEAMEQYLQSVEARIRIKTGGTVEKFVDYIPGQRKAYNLGKDNGNTALRSAIADGVLVDRNKKSIDFLRNVNEQASKDEISAMYRGIQTFLDDGIELGMVKTSEPLREVKGFLGNVEMLMDKMVDVAFYELMTKPNSYLSRSPVFKQNYWGWVLGNIGDMNKKTQAKFIKDARAAKIPKDFIDEMVAEAGFRSGKLNDFDLLNTQAKGFGLASTKQLLYDASKKHKLSDVTRNIFPFPEVWFELTQTWSKLLLNNPYKARQAHLAVESLRNTPNVTGVGGWIMPDPSGSGNEMFVYPGTGLLTKLIYGKGEIDPETGEPVESRIKVAPQGYVTGINLLGQGFIPGVMPHVGIALDWVYPKIGLKQEQERMLSNMFFGEFGKPDAAIPVPSWLQKFIGFLDDEGRTEYGKLRASTTMDVWRYGKAIGRDKVLLKEGKLNKFLEDGLNEEEAYLAWSKEAAGRIFLLRGLVQFFGPTGFTPKFYIEDKTGQLWATQVLADEYQKILKKNNGDDHATYNEFFTTYGIEHPWLTSGKTQSKVGKVAQTQAVQDWQEKNQDKLDKFKYTKWYLYPDNPYDKLDFEARYDLYKTDDVQRLTPEEYQLKMNDTIGFFRYKAFERQAVAAGFTGQALMMGKRIYQDALIKELPGYTFKVGLLSSISSKAMLHEIETKWFDDEFAMSTDAGKGLKDFWPIWLQAREISKEFSDSESDTWFLTSSSTEAKAIRLGLNQIAIEIGKEYPDFAVLYLGVFQKLYRDDLDMIGG